jgi:hypothetical protein
MNREIVHVGEYRGREVLFCNDLRLATDTVRSAVLLLVLPVPPNEESLRSVAQTVVELSPLAVRFGGGGGRRAWELACDQAALNPEPQMMLYPSYSGYEDSVSELFCGTYPDEERFDEWRSFVVVAYDHPDEILECVRKWLRADAASGRR